ncbi:MAG: ABC transporter ATP-binding protein [Candidatus Hodarchaeales archaeon]|jgi:ABC-type lipoprotein export system ATPase subunit
MEKNEYILELKDVHKIYGQGTPNEVHALRGVNLNIRKGEMVAMMGPSGCGKTTMLHIIGGLSKPTSGTVLVNGINLEAFSGTKLADFRNRELGFIFQLFNLFPFLTALQNVLVPLLIQRLDEGEARTRANIILRELGLGGRMDHRPGELSGGQEQRVAIARALVTQPSILLGDEPTGDLDTLTSSDIMDLFRRLNLENKQTMLLVTHNKFVGNECDRIIRMNDGIVVDDDL